MLADVLSGRGCGGVLIDEPELGQIGTLISRFCAMMLALGLTTVACTRPVKVASTRAVVLPIWTRVRSFPGDRYALQKVGLS